MEYIIAEVNVSEGTFIQRPMTPEEIAIDEANRAEAASKELEKIQAANVAAASKAALLDKLGITEEEAQLLLGGN
jgi:hypothetical protein